MTKSVRTRSASKTIHIQSAQGTLCGQSFSDDCLDFVSVEDAPTCKRCIKSANAEKTTW